MSCAENYPTEVPRKGFFEMVTLLCRWFWAVAIDERLAELPVVIASEVERHICLHRRDRKMLLELMPNQWEAKLADVNKRGMAIVYSRRLGGVVSQKYVKKNTVTVKGQLQFAKNCGKGMEILRIHFEPLNGEVASPQGVYQLEGRNWGPYILKCVARKGSTNGWDLLKEAYAGQKTKSCFVRHT
jgi:hypothetical protein